MGYNYCKDHRSGITYVYEMEKTIDEATGRSKVARKLIGKLDEKGNIVPTSGRRGRLPKNQIPNRTEGDMAVEETERLKNEVEELKNTIATLRRNHREIIKGLEGLLALAREQQD